MELPPAFTAQLDATITTRWDKSCGARAGSLAEQLHRGARSHTAAESLGDLSRRNTEEMGLLRLEGLGFILVEFGGCWVGVFELFSIAFWVLSCEFGLGVWLGLFFIGFGMHCRDIHHKFWICHKIPPTSIEQ